MIDTKHSTLLRQSISKRSLGRAVCQDAIRAGGGGGGGMGILERSHREKRPSFPFILRAPRFYVSFNAVRVKGGGGEAVLPSANCVYGRLRIKSSRQPAGHVNKQQEQKRKSVA